MGSFTVRRIVTIAVVVAGALLAAFGVSLAVLLGPDGMRTSGPQPLDTDATVIVTDPEVLRWTNARIHVNASFEGPKTVFIGVGNAVDVGDYVAEARRTEVTSFRTPWEVETREIDGEPTLPAAPTALDWWIAYDAGISGANLDFTVPEETVQVVIMGFEGSDLAGMTLEVAYSLPVGFTGVLGLVPLGMGVSLVGWWIGAGRPFWLVSEEDEAPAGPDPLDADPAEEVVEEHDPSSEVPAEAEEEVVYVWIDDDGVEHEISAEEAAGFEVVEHRVEDESGPGETKEAPR